MISTEVGIETLPNCYVNLIEVSKADPFNDEMVIEILVKDIKNSNGKFSWYKDPYLYKHIKLMCVLSTNSELNSNLDTGSIEFSKNEIQKAAINGGYTIHTKSLIGCMVDMLEEREVDQGTLVSFKYKFKFKVPVESQQVKVYASLFVDTAEFSSDKKINLSSRMLKVYRGPVSSESIKQNSSFTTLTTVFIKPNGQQYSGPVHLHGESYMEGSQHSSSPHSTLELLTIPNPKLKLYRQQIYKRPPTKSQDFKVPMFSDLYVSYADEKSAAGVFTLNTRSAILKNNVYARRLATLNRPLFDSMMSQVRILSLSIDKVFFTPRRTLNKQAVPKQGIRKKLGFTEIVRSKDSTQQTLISINNKQAALEEIVFNQDLDERTFMFRDSPDKAPKQRAKYAVSVSFSTPFKQYLQNVKQETQTLLSKIQAYSELAVLKSRRIKGPGLSEYFINQQMSLYPDASTAPWTTSVVNYASLLTLIKQTDQDVDTIVQQELFLVHPEHATSRSIQSFIKKYSAAYSQFLKAYGLRDLTYKSDSNRGTPKNNTNPIVKISKTFPQTVSFAGRGSNVSYLKFNSPVFPIITTTELANIGESEVKKYFKTSPSFKSSGISKKSKEFQNTFSEYKSSLVTYLNPMLIRKEDKAVKVGEFDSVDYDLLNEIIDGPRKIKRQDEIKPRKQRVSTLSFKKAKKAEVILEKKLKATKKVDQNLGSESNFKTVETRFKEKNSRIVNSKTKRLLNKPRVLKPKKKLFSLKNAEVSKKLQNNLKMVKKIPIAIKSVMLSESSNVKKDFLKKENKMIESAKTSNAFRACFQSPVKLEILGDYKKDEKGNKYFSKSNWKTLDQNSLQSLQTPTICRMSYHYIEGLTDPLDDFYITNKYFIITPSQDRLVKVLDQTQFPSEQRTAQTQELLNNFKSEYATSNIIQQFQGNINFRTRSNVPASPQPVQTQQTVERSTTTMSTGGSTSRGGY